jgi:hypothetical protein
VNVLDDGLSSAAKWAAEMLRRRLTRFADDRHAEAAADDAGDVPERHTFVMARP